MDKINLDKINDLVISAYDNIATYYTEAYAENDDADSKYIDHFISTLNGFKILDMGCGTGTNTNYLKKKGMDIIGIDLSRNMLTVARKLFPNVYFEQQNILKTSFSDRSFDGIVLSYVINHFNTEGINLLFNEIDRLLKKNGVLYIAAHIGDKEEILSDPLDDNVQIYYNFLSIDKLDSVFSNYDKVYYDERGSYGKEEFLCNKMFVIYRKVEE